MQPSSEFRWRDAPNAFAQFIDISYGGNPSSCSDASVAGLILGGRWHILEGTRMELREGVFITEGIHEDAAGATAKFTFILHPDLSAQIR